MAKPTTIKIRLNSTANTGYFYVTKKNARTMTEKLVQFIQGTLYGNETPANEPYFDSYSRGRQLHPQQQKQEDI